MFFKSKKPEIPKEDSRIQDLNIISINVFIKRTFNQINLS